MSKKRSSGRLPKQKIFDGFQMSKSPSRKKHADVISTQLECGGAEKITQTCSFVDTSSESSTDCSIVNSINDSSTANKNDHHDVRNRTPGDRQQVLLPPLRMEHISNCGGENYELTFLSEEVYNAKSTSCETFGPDLNFASQIVVSDIHEDCSHTPDSLPVETILINTNETVITKQISQSDSSTKSQISNVKQSQMNSMGITSCMNRHQCDKCTGSFKSSKGLKIHQRSCKELVISAIPESEIDNHSLDYKSQIKSAYEHMVKWRKNIFQIPKGMVGKAFVDEITFFIDG